MSTTPRRRDVIGAPKSDVVKTRVRRDVLGDWNPRRSGRGGLATRASLAAALEPPEGSPIEVYERAADMPGAKALPDVRRELFAQNMAKGMPQYRAYMQAQVNPVDETTAMGMASKWVRERPIADRIAYHMRLSAEVAGITQERIAREIEKVAFAQVRVAAKWGDKALGGRIVLKPSDLLDDDISAAIAEVSETKEGLKVKFHPKMDALTKLGQRFGMFIERKEITGAGGEPLRLIGDAMSASEAAEAYADMVKGGG